MDRFEPRYLRHDTVDHLACEIHTRSHTYNLQGRSNWKSTRCISPTGDILLFGIDHMKVLMDQPRSESKAAAACALFLQTISTAAVIGIVVVLALILVELQKIKNGDASVAVYLPDNVRVLMENTLSVGPAGGGAFLVKNIT